MTVVELLAEECGGVDAILFVTVSDQLVQEVRFTLILYPLLKVDKRVLLQRQ